MPFRLQRAEFRVQSLSMKRKGSTQDNRCVGVRRRANKAVHTVIDAVTLHTPISDFWPLATHPQAPQAGVRGRGAGARHTSQEAQDDSPSKFCARSKPYRILTPGGADSRQCTRTAHTRARGGLPTRYVCTRGIYNTDTQPVKTRWHVQCGHMLGRYSSKAC